VPSEVSFNRQIAKIKRRVFIQAINRILLNAATFFLCISIFSFTFKKAGIIDYNINGTWHFTSIGISLSAALFIGLVTRRRILNVLIDIDRRLKLEDRLSTAYEYLRFKKKTEFSILLMEDAAAKLRPFEYRQLLPARFSALHLLAIILLIINILLYSGVFFEPAIKATHQDPAKIENAAKVLKNYSISGIENKAVRKSNPNPGYAKKLEQFSNTLKDSSIPLEQRFAMLDNFLKEVQGEQTRMANELGTKLESADIEELGIQKIPDLANLSSSQLEKIKKLLGRIPDNRLSLSMSEDIELLQDLDSIEKLLSRIIDDLKDGRSLTGDSAELDGNESLASSSNETIEQPSNDLNQPHPDQILDHTLPAEGRTDHTGSRKRQMTGNDLQDGTGMGKPEEYSDSAGSARSKKEKKSSYELEIPSGTAEKDKMTPSPAKSYLIHIRALTDIGEARLKEEEVFQTYHKEIESILQKEDIPSNYREYIKNYFISIGMNTEESTHESK
jgi:hypothetical protein